MISQKPAFTLDEKTSLLSGQDMWSTKQVHHVEMSPIVLADGPHGLRYQHGNAADHMGVYDSAPATCLPPAVALASSWDPQLTARAAEALGREARALGVNVLLGPGV